MAWCAVKLCRNFQRKLGINSNISFHRFPADPVVSKRWADVIKQTKDQDDWKPSKYSHVCSEHFAANNFYVTKMGIRKLKKESVPSKALFLSSKKIDESNDENVNSTQKVSEKLHLNQSSSEAESENSEEFEIHCKNYQGEEKIKTIVYSSPQPSTSTVESSYITIVSNIKSNKNTEVDEHNRTTLHNKDVFNKISDIHSSEMNSAQIYNLRQDLRRKTELLIKKDKLIRTLKQNLRRYKQRNESLKQILLTFKKQRFIDNNI